MPYFVAEGISKYYQQRPIIADIHTAVEQGELVSLLGVSGVGKTTLFNVLSGLERPDSGSVCLDGQDITGIPGRVGYMQQKDLLLPFKTMGDNLCLPLILQGKPKSEALERVREFLPVFGLDLPGFVNQYPSQLSGGMRQRAALLRSFLFTRSLMLLDEPFSALDAITKAAMHEWFIDIRQRLSLSTLLITHDVDEAILLSQRIYIMAGKPGRITAEIVVPFSTEERLHPVRPDMIAMKLDLLNRLRSSAVSATDAP